VSDISDLEGIFPTALRWNAENGVLGYTVFDAATGERGIEVIELGSQRAKFALDYATRQRGYGLIRVGVYDMRLTSVGSPPPELTEEMEKDGYKPAVGCWAWNPILGEHRLDTNAVLFLKAIVGLWDSYRTFKEAAQGMAPIAHFVDRREEFIKAVGKTFWAPIIKIIGFVPRGKIEPFAMRSPTVKPPLAIDSQVSFALLEAPRPEGPSTDVQQRLRDKLSGNSAATPAKPKSVRPKRDSKRGEPPESVDSLEPPKPPERGPISDLIDDWLPDDPIPEL
jgi:hypothetical protein